MNVVACLLLARPGQAQITPTEPGAAVSPDHQHASPAPPWTVNVDGGLFATFNHQGGPRGGRDFRSQNWLMGMAARPIGPGRLIASAMLSLEPLTVGAGGYAELLQIGEAYNGLMNTDRQHPHELFSQLAVGWSQRLAQTTVTVLGAPVGEAALGPPAFMHRASAAENPAAPLAHHILDSTHIASSVIAVRIDQGRFSVEGSSFRGREPDDRHYDVEFGQPDSWAARVWFRPTSTWTLQASHGFLNEPEQLEPGDQRRTSGSASWLKRRGSGFTAVTMAVGRNRRVFSTLNALLLEATHRRRSMTAYARAERLQVETEVLLFPFVVSQAPPRGAGRSGDGDHRGRHPRHLRAAWPGSERGRRRHDLCAAPAPAGDAWHAPVVVPRLSPGGPLESRPADVRHDDGRASHAWARPALTGAGRSRLALAQRDDEASGQFALAGAASLEGRRGPSQRRRGDRPVHVGHSLAALPVIGRHERDLADVGVAGGQTADRAQPPAVVAAPGSVDAVRRLRPPSA